MADLDPQLRAAVSKVARLMAPPVGPRLRSADVVAVNNDGTIDVKFAGSDVVVSNVVTVGAVPVGAKVSLLEEGGDLFAFGSPGIYSSGPVLLDYRNYNNAGVQGIQLFWNPDNHPTMFKFEFTVEGNTTAGGTMRMRVGNTTGSHNDANHLWTYTVQRASNDLAGGADHQDNIFRTGQVRNQNFFMNGSVMQTYNYDQTFVEARSWSKAGSGDTTAEMSQFGGRLPAPMSPDPRLARLTFYAPAGETWDRINLMVHGYPSRFPTQA